MVSIKIVVALGSILAGIANASVYDECKIKKVTVYKDSDCSTELNMGFDVISSKMFTDAYKKYKKCGKAKLADDSYHGKITCTKDKMVYKPYPDSDCQESMETGDEKKKVNKLMVAKYNIDLNKCIVNEMGFFIKVKADAPKAKPKPYQCKITKMLVYKDSKCKVLDKKGKPTISAAKYKSFYLKH